MTGDDANVGGGGEAVRAAARSLDRDRYLAALLSPRSARSDLIALAAFMGEVARIPLTVGGDWGTGAYVVATLRRPLDEAASRMPGRAIGLQWFSVDKNARTLSVEMPLPSLMRPNGPLRVPLKLAGLNTGEEAKIVVAAVDVGILNLTNYKPPAPDDFYLGQRRLSAELRVPSSGWPAHSSQAITY